MTITPMQKTMALLFVLCGCTATTEEEKAQRAAPVQMAVEDSGRFEIKRVSVFADPLAYYDKRGVYLITDRKTGAEFVGVSGVGISEVARHSSGKASHEDER